MLPIRARICQCCIVLSCVNAFQCISSEGSLFSMRTVAAQVALRCFKAWTVTTAWLDLGSCRLHCQQNEMLFFLPSDRLYFTHHIFAELLVLVFVILTLHFTRSIPHGKGEYRHTTVVPYTLAGRNEYKEFDSTTNKYK